MVKAEFIDKLVSKIDNEKITKKEVVKFLDAFEEILTEDIFHKEDSVKLGIGTFQGVTKITKERNARNPKTGETIVVPGKTVKGFPKYKPTKALKEGC